MSAAEIADLALKGLPIGKRQVNDIAIQKGWNSNEGQCRRRANRGGGREYHITLLPEDARLDYQIRMLRVDKDGADLISEAVSHPDAWQLSAGASVARDARLLILDASRTMGRQSGLSAAAADRAFAALYNAGQIDLAAWIKTQVPRVSVRTLARWRSLARADRSNRLGYDSSSARRGKGLLEVANGGEVQTHMLGVIVFQPHLSAEAIRNLVIAKFGETIHDQNGEVRAIPPLRTFQHHLKALKATRKVELVALTNPDLFRGKYKASGLGTFAWVRHVNQLWQIDASPADVLCVDGRYSIYLLIDIWTRRIIIYVSRTPRAQAVAMLIRKGILAWGAPRAVKTDRLRFCRQCDAGAIRRARYRGHAVETLRADREGACRACDRHLPAPIDAAATGLHRPQRRRPEEDRGASQLRGSARHERRGSLLRPINDHEPAKTP
ncbi:MAG TPA: hypothetical protein VIJ42_09205 [Stellaceae bacterium]